MEASVFSRVGILGIGSYFPTQVVTNDMIAPEAGVTEEWIIGKTGIQTRRQASADEATSDLGLAAAHAALKDAETHSSDISLIVFATSSPDTLSFPMASYLATELNCPLEVASFDVNAACSGFLSGLSVAEMHVALTGERALVVGADTHTRFRNPADKRSAALWGDGAGAVVVGPLDTARCEVIATRLTRSPAGFDIGGVPAGGSRLPASRETVENSQHFLRLNGRRVGEIFAEHVPTMIESFLKDAGFVLAEIDHIVPHQGNQKLVESIGPMLGVDPAKVHASAKSFGNTGSATIPTTLDMVVQADRIRSGETVLLFSIGVGMTYGFSLLRWR